MTTTAFLLHTLASAIALVTFVTGMFMMLMAWAG